MYFLQNFVSHFPRPSFHCRFFHKRGGGGEKHEEEDLEETGGSANGSGGGWVEGARQGRSLFFFPFRLFSHRFVASTHIRTHNVTAHHFTVDAASHQHGFVVTLGYAVYTTLSQILELCCQLYSAVVCSRLLQRPAVTSLPSSRVEKRQASISLSTARLISYSVLVRGRFETTGFFFLILDSQRMCVKLHAVCVQTGCLTLCYRVRV